MNIRPSHLLNSMNGLGLGNRIGKKQLLAATILGKLLGRTVKTSYFLTKTISIGKSETPFHTETIISSAKNKEVM